MSAARTARRRRKQASQGYNGLKQVFGKNAPVYPGKISKEKSARLLAQKIQTERRIAQGKK